jgi:hypothetical protein
MDSSLIQTLAKIAGIGGIALGVFLLLFREIIRKTIFPTFTKGQGYKIIRLMLVLIWSVAIAGILAWLYVNSKESSSSQRSDSVRDQAKASPSNMNSNSKEIQTQKASSNNSNTALDVAFIGGVLFADGREVRGCKISDHNPGPMGSGWNESSVGYSNNLDAALNHSTNRSSRFPYSKIHRIDVLPFNTAEKGTITRMELYDRDKVLKCNVEFHDGNSIKGIFLLPHYLKYECTNETGRIMRDTIKALMFYPTK